MLALHTGSGVAIALEKLAAFGRHVICREQTMKAKYLHGCFMATLAGGLGLVSGCVVEPNGRVAFQPVVVQAPPPVTVVPAAPVDLALVPDDYVWDGYEYVGLVGDQYYYLGPGNVWLVCEPFRLERFHGWERGHPDWHVHAVRNVQYRRDAQGHEHPRRDVRKDEH
jgi:hypothetical protein